MIIDFRMRPPVEGVTSLSVYQDVSMFCTVLHNEPPDPAAVKRDMNLLLQEMKELDIVHGVCAGRMQDETQYCTSNDGIGKLVKQYPDKFTGFAGIDHRDTRKAIAEIERCTKELGLKGINMDVGLYRSPQRCLDDPIIYPIYDYCQEMGIPVMSTVCSVMGHDMMYAHPVHVDHVARDFPKLTFIMAHAAWPFAEEACGICLTRRNVYLQPDIYGTTVPGHMHYVEAANSYLQDRVLYGSAFPMRNLKLSVKAHKALPFRPEVAEKYFYKNAARLLGLT